MSETDSPIRRVKDRLAQRAIRKHKARSFADLGGVWGVNSGYALSLLEHNEIDKAFVIDAVINARSRERAAPFPQLQFKKALLGAPTTPDLIPDVDAILMYDILLHQVSPNWDEFIAMWARKTRILVIFNQNWTKDEHSVRFIERGRDWYKENVHFTNEKKLDEWFDSHGKINHGLGKLEEERYAFWQWGITTDDMIKTCRSVGFRLDFYENHGRFPACPHEWIQDESFIFVRQEPR